MHIAFIASDEDPAGSLMLRTLEGRKNELETSHAYSFHLLNEPLLTADNLELRISADTFIFLSKHRSGANTPSFAIHPIGNWGEAQAGGKKEALCPTNAALMHAIFLELHKNHREEYECTMEATHHGPFTTTPSMFVEVGSTEKEWTDQLNADIVAESIIAGIENFSTSQKKPTIAVGIGGPHYCNNFNKLALRNNIAFSHICPKHHLEKFDENLLLQALSSDAIDRVILDWKGMGDQKQRVLALLEAKNLSIERTDKLLK